MRYSDPGPTPEGRADVRENKVKAMWSRGETVVTLISDDNFNHILQRTLLLQFSVSDTGIDSAAARPKPAP